MTELNDDFPPKNGTDMGGPNGDIDAATSAKGLIACFTRLGPGHTGVFENYDATPLAY